MILPIIKLWSKQDSVLLHRSELVRDFDESLKTLVANMFETMYAASGVGLAAPQIGIPKRVAVINVDYDTNTRKENEIVLINPGVISSTGSKTEDEGCLSIPGLRSPVQRPLTITVRAQGLDGKYFEITGEGLLAKALNHEIDHLQGLLYIHRISSVRRTLVLNQVKKLKRKKQWS